jgi:hypothetical protein
LNRQSAFRKALADLEADWQAEVATQLEKLENKAAAAAGNK